MAVLGTSGIRGTSALPRLRCGLLLLGACLDLALAADFESHRGVPCPPSPVIAEIRWAPKETILRRARGSDNWPLTWADDDALYTAYGDGNGFEPFTPEKLSLGFARIAGQPEDLTAENVRSASGEARGDGPLGRKASGLLSQQRFRSRSPT